MFEDRKHHKINNTLEITNNGIHHIMNRIQNMNKTKCYLQTGTTNVHQQNRGFKYIIGTMPEGTPPIGGTLGEVT